MPPSFVGKRAAALGARPTHELAVFAYGFDTSSDDRIGTPSADFGQRLQTASGNVGLRYRLAPTSQLRAPTSVATTRPASKRRASRSFPTSRRRSAGARSSSA